MAVCDIGGLNIVIYYLEHLDPALYALCLIAVKSYGAHHFDLVIGHLDAAHYALRLKDAKIYGAHHLDLAFGHVEHLDATHYAL